MQSGRDARAAKLAARYNCNARVTSATLLSVPFVPLTLTLDSNSCFWWWWWWRPNCSFALYPRANGPTVLASMAKDLEPRYHSRPLDA